MFGFNLWREAESQREWFAIIAGAASKFADGFFWQELVQHHMAVDGTLDGVALDPASGDDAIKLEKPLRVELRLFEKWGLLSHRMTTPRDGAFTSSLRLRKLDEAQGRLTPKGARLAMRSAERQRLVFFRMLLWFHVGPMWKKSRAVSAGVASAFGVLKWVLHWGTEKAAIGTAITAAVAIAALIFRPGD